ncbi:PREDICTED: growth-regulating factor 8-like isoform X1 [Nicotiana attenuata]|uniref:Growth-regulating factor n=1 Tax=Nicotiana attenuata TaxID=49451 RepID=A0A1J6ISR1_NICAT|nr:PREDICTED: growth-regulating factor 8-like isoform X1 [Nicotiana attenuata]OIT08245.1 growth-regulating factor 7 [Nicotiana attenuata]
MGLVEGSINGFNVSDKAKLDVGKISTTTTTTICYNFQLQNTESFPSKIMMVHHQDPHRPFSDDDDNGGGGDSGPTLNHNEANKMPSSNEHNVYSDASFLPPLPPPVTGGAAVVRTFQPFDISTNSSPVVEGMAAALGFPFTWSQWKELEKQAMIYKYMVSAIPVPPDLLLSICTNSSGASLTTSASGSVQGQRCRNIRDLEPGRCKRTDGKKWRCSRDVALHQKYCERHMHRGRPRSRKHVEVHAPLNNNNDNKKTRNHPVTLESTPIAVPKPPPTGQTNSLSTQPLRSAFQQMEGPLFLHDKMGQNISTDSSFNELHRSSGWTMEGELVAKAGAGQQWQHLMDSNIHPADWQDSYREEALNLLACRDLERTEDVSMRHNGEFNFMINPELLSLDKQTVREAPRDLINAWSNDNIYNNSNNENMEEGSLWPSEGNISPSSLTLSMAMAAGNALDEDMGLESSVMNNSYQNKSWEKFSWVPFASGGPLAEVLHPSSSINQGENPASSYTSNCDSISPAATTVSSPSGVLQRTMFSHSDGSVCNSPILAPPTNTSETVPFQWLS